MSNFYKIIFCFLLCSLYPHTHSLLFFVCNYFLSFVVFFGPRPRHKKAAGGHSHPTQVTAPASLSLGHHGRPSELAWFLTAFHQRESPSLSSREVSLVLRLKSLWPIVSPYSCHKRESRSWIQSAAAAAGRMWDANLGHRAASCELSE